MNNMMIHVFSRQCLAITGLAVLMGLSACKDAKQTQGITQNNQSTVEQSLSTGSINNSQIEAAFHAKRSHVQVEARGEVAKVLPDDNDGSRHQRFIVKVNNDMKILIAHNIDLATRVEHLQVGEHIEFYGEYIFNPKGGIVHWTHRDPANRRENGWIKYQGVTYQ